MSTRLALIIEDNEELCNIYAATLETLNYEVESVLDGKRALQRLDEIVPQLVVLDMNLPFVSGHYIYKKMRAEARFDRTPIIIATANALIADALIHDIAPIDRLMVKPVSPNQLRNAALDVTRSGG